MIKPRQILAQSIGENFGLVPHLTFSRCESASFGSNGDIRIRGLAQVMEAQVMEVKVMEVTAETVDRLRQSPTATEDRPKTG